MKLKKIYIVLIIFMVAISCNEDDYLDKKPIDFLSPDSFTSEKDVREAVNGIYKAFISDKEEPIKTDFIVDNGYYVGYNDMWTRTYNSESPFIEAKWSRNYKMILRANTVLHYMDNVELSDAIYNQHKGEAKFLRALAYFDLSEFYGDVPLRTAPESLSEADKAVTAKGDIVNFVLDELEEAAELLPVTYAVTERGRATKGAALAIKARVYLYNGLYDKAVEYCQKVKALDQYSLMDDFYTMFLPETEGSNTESIFEMQFETDARAQDLSNNWYSYFVQWGGFQILVGLEQAFYTTNGLALDDPNNDMYDTTINTDIFNPDYIIGGGYDNRFSNRDPRLYATLMVPYSIRDYRSDGEPVILYPDHIKNANFTGIKAKKYADYSDNKITFISGVNPVIIRYADILLMEAEALIELGGYDESYVRSLIDEVRQRPSVMMPKVEDAEGTGLSQEELRDIVRHERRVEFALEGLRYFDVKRWDVGAEVLTDGLGYRPDKLKNNSAEYEIYAYQPRTFDPVKGYLWPIPKSETDSNKSIPSN
ncbi:RagB/SusD family nutrient uptake outer membrane protein [uncultured Draconibacterium sp.]|uniref:RagB/SusD family nutrient uptake outer membrane protein n=1 Tax=uncultured Draconibacterium sp. TaxID=1573823 RepID=UPI0025FD4840|nr:RagB/SusD family nutrient uptake outer membrane protein [uncultured Draconibacterium sp.]